MEGMNSSNMLSSDDFNPLKEPVEHKPQKQRQVNPDLLNQDIPEPTINLSSVHNEEDLFGNEALPGSKKTPKAEYGSNGQTKAPESFNPDLNDLPPSQKEQAAENFAGLIWGGYQKLHDFGNNLLQIPDRKIISWQTSGEVDLTIPVPYTNTDWMPMAEFIQEYNQQAGKTFSISQEFKDEVNPVLIRVLKKYGHGLTDEQFLMSMFAQDMVFKAAKGYQMKAVTNSIIQFAKEQTKNAKVGVESTTSAQTPPPPPNPEQQQEVATSSDNSNTSNPIATQHSGDAQSNAIAELVVGANQGNVKQAIPVFGSETHLAKAKEISERTKNKSKEPKRRGRKPKEK